MGVGLTGGDIGGGAVVRLRRGPLSIMWSYPVLGGSAITPQFAVLVLPLALAAWNPIVGVAVAVVLVAMAVPAVTWRAEISGNELRCSTLGFDLLRVDLRRTNGVCRQISSGNGYLSRVLVLDGPTVTYRRFGDPNALLISLEMANCLGARRERKWLNEIGSRTKRGYLGKMRSDGTLQ